MTRYYDERHNWAYPAKYQPRPGFAPVPQHVPGPADGETPEAYADRLYAMGYLMSDARNLAGLPPA